MRNEDKISVAPRLTRVVDLEQKVGRFFTSQCEYQQVACAIGAM